MAPTDSAAIPPSRTEISALKEQNEGLALGVYYGYPARREGRGRNVS